MDLKCGCIEIENDYYHQVENAFDLDYSTYSEAIVKEECEASLLKYLEESNKWQKGQIPVTLWANFDLKKGIPLGYGYYYRLYYEMDDENSVVYKYSIGIYDFQTNRLSYDGFSL